MTVAVTTRDDAILRAFYTYRLLTVEQVTRLLYRRGSREHVRKALKRLEESRHLQRFRNHPNAAWVYTLARRGITYLTAAGYGDFWRFRPSEQRDYSFLFLAHTLGVTDFLITAKLLEEQDPRIRIAQLRHEWQLKQQAPIKVTTSQNEATSVIPDAFLDFHLQGGDHIQQMCIVLEYDRATMEQKAIKRKVRALLAFAQGPYQQAFGTSSLTIAFATPCGASRAHLLRRWCEQVLTEEREEELADLFLFAALPAEAGALDPQTLFLSPIWHVPFAGTPTPLLLL